MLWNDLSDSTIQDVRLDRNTISVLIAKYDLAMVRYCFTDVYGMQSFSPIGEELSGGGEDKAQEEFRARCCLLAEEPECEARVFTFWSAFGEIPVLTVVAMSCRREELGSAD